MYMNDTKQLLVFETRTDQKKLLAIALQHKYFNFGDFFS